MTKFLVTYISNGKMMVEADDEEEAKAIVAKAVRERNLRPKLMLTAENLDDIPVIEDWLQ